MTRFTPTAANTVLEDWQAGDYVDETKFKEQIGQNVEYLMQTHNHDGDLGDGGTLPTADPKSLWFFTSAAGSPFA